MRRISVLVFPSRPGRKSSIRPFSTYGEVAPPPVGGRRLQREIALFFHRAVEPVVRAKFQQVLLVPSLPNVLDDLLLDSEFLCQTFDQGGLRSSLDSV